MQIELTQLMRDRAVAHPSRIVAVEFDGRDLRVGVTGWPWWNDEADRTPDHRIDFLFHGVNDGVLRLPDFGAEDDEALEAFGVIEAGEVSWAKPEGSDIYCNGPLPRPLDVYVAVHDFLVSQGAFRRASDFLNCANGELLSPFFKMVETGSYLLGRFPTALRDVVCAQLESQNVSFSELKWNRAAAGQGLLVTFGGSQFFCQSATASFER
jgi:hypothetical protein